MIRMCALVLVSLAVCAAVLTAADDKAPAPAKAAAPEKQTQKQKASYCLGMILGRQLRQQGVAAVHLDPGTFVKGLQGALAGEKPAMSNEEIQKVTEAFQAEISAHGRLLATANLKKGEDFLAANGKKEGIKTTATGLQYMVLVEGKGKSPKATDTVACRYKGTLIDGKVFDESGDEPATFELNGVIPGWTEGLQLMKEGGKCMFYVPAKLAYRDSPRGPGGPNSALIFEVELVKVK